MRSNYRRTTLRPAILTVAILLLMALVSSAQTVNLTASRQTTTLPDGSSIPMWGWTCGTGATAATGATCTALTYNTSTGALNPQTSGTTWQPPLIVVPYVATGTNLTINLTNSLPVETSLVIMGQFGGGLGTPVREAGPRTDGAHAGQTATTWTTVTGATFTPPAQGQRARSFVAEVAGAPVGGTPASGAYSWTGLKPGTYLMRTGTYPSIQGPMGLYGVLIVTKAPVGGTSAGLAYPVPGSTAGGITYDADAALLLSEVDPRQNNAVAALFQASGALTNASFSETTKWNPTCAVAHACYPPAVDYTPLYFLINGQGFSRDNLTASALSIPAAASSGNVLLRLVNAGSHMHIPSVAGLNMSLIAEDGNVLPDVALASSLNKPLTVRVQNEVFQAAGKVYDVIVNPPQSIPGTFDTNTFAVFDRALSLSTNNQRDGGMQGTLDVNDSGAAKLTAANSIAVANPDAYAYAPGVTLTVSDPGKGVVANDVNVYGVQVSTLPTSGALTLSPNGTFAYVPTGSGTDHFGYCANGTTTASAVPICTTVTLNVSSTVGQGPIANPDRYSSNVSSLLRVAAPGVLGNDVDPNGYPMTAVLVSQEAGLAVTLNSDGSFTATKSASPSCAAPTGCTFTYQAKNSQNSLSNITTATLIFPTPSNLSVTVQDANTKAQISDYKWIIEQDLTFHIDPACQQNGAGGPKPANCPAGLPPSLGTNFHTSYMPVIATGCTGPQSCERGQTVYDPVSGSHLAASCDGYGICTPGLAQLPASFPSQVNLSAKNPDGTPASYYISILPGDAANSFNTGNSSDPTKPGNCATKSTATGQSVPECGHTMGGAPIRPPVAGVFVPVTVNLEPNPLPTATVTVFVFEDDFPLNGEPDTGGGADAFPSQEAGLEDFQVELWDDAGGSGDATGQMTYDMFNEPLSNSLNGTIDPNTGFDSCPISNTGGVAIGVIIVCPKFESDGKTLSPLVGQAVVKNLMPGRFSVIVHPGAAREGRGEEWLQTNTLDGTHFQDSFIKAGEPAYFQEYGPGGYHVQFGMANPAIINARLPVLCNASGAAPCRNTVTGQAVNLHQGRSPNENLYDSGLFPQGDPKNYAPLAYTSCYAALGDTDGETFAFTKCDANGNFTFTGIPDGNWSVVVFDQWLDLLVDGSSRSVSVSGGQTLNLEYGSFSWQAHLWSNTYMDLNGNGVQDPGEPGLLQVPTRIRMRNGKFNNTLFSDINGRTHFDETSPIFNWYVVESDTTRFRGTGVHVVNDAGGQLDGPAPKGNGNTGPYQAILNSSESFPLPNNLRVPGAVYCGKPDCSDVNLLTNPNGGGGGGSSGRIDPGSVVSEGWQGGTSEFGIMDWGKLPYVPGENGGIRGHIVYASTRPFNDPTMLFQNLWEPLVPRVTVNLYREGTAPDGTTSLTLVDTTKTSSWDDWAQGFRADGVTPNMNCVGQDTADPFFSYTMAGTPNYLNPGTPLPNNSQYKCYDSYHNLNQVQPAPYDGLYQFPSPYCANNPGGTIPGTTVRCATIPNPALSAPVHTGAAAAVLPPAKYVVEEITPSGYELNKEEDLNLLIGDNYIAPVTQQFGPISNIFIVPDQASIDAYNQSYTGPWSGPLRPRQPERFQQFRSDDGPRPDHLR